MDEVEEKKVKSFNLSTKAIKIIETYKKENRLGSNSLALDKILVDEYSKKEIIDEKYIRKIIEDIILKNKDLATNKVENAEILVEEVFDEVKASSIETMKRMMEEINK